jgi:hypothetical protein
MTKAILAVLLAAGCVGTSIAHELKVDADESLALIAPAKGVQIYQCRGGHWAFVAPDAELFDTHGMKIGRHYAGPQWEAFDGSRVIAKVKARSDAPVPSAIPWLLLEAHSVGSEGRFSAVSSIRRVNTTGGVAPTAPCSAGQVLRVPYSADYYFFSRN